MYPMGLMAIGEKAEIAGNGMCGDAERPVHAREDTPRRGCAACGRHGGGNGATARIEDMGIRPGKIIEMLSNEGGRALLVKVDETRIAVGRSVAMKIMVRRVDDESCNA